MGVTGFDGKQEVNRACRALGVSLNLRENINCQRTFGSRGLIDRDVSPLFVCGGGRGVTLQAGPKLVLSGGGRELSGLAGALSRSVGVGNCEF